MLFSNRAFKIIGYTSFGVGIVALTRAEVGDLVIALLGICLIVYGSFVITEEVK